MKEWESRSAQALTSFNNLLNCTHIHAPIPNLFPHCFVVHFEICYLFSVFPGTPDAQTAAAKWLQGIRWKAILFAICWRNIFSILTSPFSALCLWLNACHLGLCWHGRARIHPNIDVSTNAIYPICRGWMAAGYQMKSNIVFYLLMTYFSNITSRFSTMWVSI